MNEKYTRRLNKLAKHLAGFSAEQNARHFRMRTFLEHDRKELTPLAALTQQVLADCYCETVACAVGHAPALFPTLVKKIDEEFGRWNESYKGDDEDGAPIYESEWWPASYRQVTESLFGVSCSSGLFEFLFGGEWDSGRYHDYDSTSWAVADRILYYLESHDDEFFYGDKAPMEHARYGIVRKGWVAEDELDKRYAELVGLEVDQGVFAITSYEGE